MIKRFAVNQHCLLVAAVVLTIGYAVAWAQDSSSQMQNSGQQASVPSPAYGVDNQPPFVENPPISGIDQPGLEPHAAPLSYLQLGAHVSEAADTNAANVLGSGTAVHSVTRALGSVELQRLWSNYDLALDYLGGAGYYGASGLGWEQVHQLTADQRINWKRGQFAVRDSFSYLPEGNFAGGYGSLSSTGEALGGFSGSGFFGGGIFGGLGQVPKIMNLALADVVENLTPKSSITASGGYALVHYTGNNLIVDNISLLGSNEVSAQAGYDRMLRPHDQVALTYGFQQFHFSNPTLQLINTSFHTHVIQAMWGHRISGRMDFRIGVGPQLTEISQDCTFIDLLSGNPHCTVVGGSIVGRIPNHRLTVAGRASFAYRFKKATLDLSFERFTTGGSGFFPGANSNIGRVSLSHPLTRVWTVIVDGGYARNSRLQQLTQQEISACAPSTGSSAPRCPGTIANTYSYGFAGLAAYRQIGHDFRVYASYQYNYLTFDNSFCGGGTVCNRISNRQIGLVGLDWTPRPMRLD